MNIRRRIITGVTLFAVLLVIGTTGYWIISGRFVDSLYMTVITVGTVGYGEMIDLSNNPAGRVFTIVFIILSLLTIATVTSMLAASILELELSGLLRRRRMNKDIAKLSNHFIICGGGDIGFHVAQELAATLRPFVVIDHNQEQLDKVTCCLPNLLYIKGDATEDGVLLTAGVEKAAGIVAALPTDKDNLYITVMAKQYNPNVRVVALSIEDKAQDKLKKVGADAVVSAVRIGGLRMASEMVRPTVVRFLDTMLRQTESTVRFEEICVPEGSHVIGKKLAELPLRDKFGLLVLAVIKLEKAESDIVYNPPASTVIQKGDVVVVLGDVDNIHKATQALQS